MGACQVFSPSEVAQQLSISKVTVYNKLNKYKSMVVIKQGKKYITEELFEIIKNDLKTSKNDDEEDIKIDPELSRSNSENETGNQELIINILKEQLEQKDQQIDHLMKIIDNTNKLVENGQVLLKNSNDKEDNVLLLESHLKEFDEKLNDIKSKMDERKKSKGFFSRK